jgi:O-antigen ligase
MRAGSSNPAIAARSPERSDAETSGRRRRRDRSGGGRAAKALMSFTLVAFCLLLVWAPLPLGSNREWPMAVLSMSIGGLLLLWGGVSAWNTRSMHPEQTRLWPAAVLLTIGLAFAAIQIIDLNQLDAMIGVSWAKDLAHPIWGMAAESLVERLPAYVSMDPYLSIAAINKIGIYAGAFWIAFQLGQHKAKATAILWAITLSGGLNALVAVFESGANFDLGSWISGEASLGGDRFNGTFVNPNNFATFAAMSLIAAMALCVPLISEGIVLNRGHDVARRTIINTLTGPAFPLASVILGIAGVITLSGSRAGTFAMLVGSLALALCLNRWGGASGKSGGQAGAWGVLAVAAIGVVVAFAPLALRLSSFEDFSSREAFASDTVTAALAAPITGNGFGAFERYFPLYASQDYPGVVNAAHNDYLEMVADIGFIGGGAMILAIVYLSALSLRGVIRRRRRKHFCAAGVAAATLCGFHAYFDFSLQIPAVGLALFALLGVGVAQSWQDRSEPLDPRTLA